MLTYYAIKTGRSYTVVTVDDHANQCSVPLRADCRSGGTFELVVAGTADSSIVRAARAGEGVSFKRLADAMASHPVVERRADLDR